MIISSTCITVGQEIFAVKKICVLNFCAKNISVPQYMYKLFVRLIFVVLAH